MRIAPSGYLSPKYKTVCETSNFGEKIHNNNPFGMQVWHSHSVRESTPEVLQRSSSRCHSFGRSSQTQTSSPMQPSASFLTTAMSYFQTALVRYGWSYEGWRWYPTKELMMRMRLALIQRSPVSRIYKRVASRYTWSSALPLSHLPVLPDSNDCHWWKMEQRPNSEKGSRCLEIPLLTSALADVERRWEPPSQVCGPRPTLSPASHAHVQRHMPPAPYGAPVAGRRSCGCRGRGDEGSSSRWRTSRRYDTRTAGLLYAYAHGARARRAVWTTCSTFRSWMALLNCGCSCAHAVPDAAWMTLSRLSR